MVVQEEVAWLPLVHVVIECCQSLAESLKVLAVVLRNGCMIPDSFIEYIGNFDWVPELLDEVVDVRFVLRWFHGPV